MTVDLDQDPNPLARHYRRFKVSERLLLTGHSHQAWPDVAFEGQAEAWDDAAAFADDKWQRAFAKADAVRSGYAARIGAAPGEIALAASTHELVVRLLSALPLRERPRLVTTEGEFHTLRRQLDRLAEERLVEVVKVPAAPSAAIAERLIAAAGAWSAAVLVSSVLFGSGQIVPGLDRVAAHCRDTGTALLVDAYHHVNVVPLDLARDGLADAFVTGGGYKYCQLGEGNAFLRVPPAAATLRPVLTGWFAEFGRLTKAPEGGVPYADGPGRWAGATYDPVSHYRAARVFEFFGERGLTPEVLREVSRRQVERLAARFDAAGLDPALIARDRDVPLERLGGFLALRCARAGEVCDRLRPRGMLADHRAAVLRLGPAPYLSHRQLDAAIETLATVVRGLG